MNNEKAALVGEASTAMVNPTGGIFISDVIGVLGNSRIVGSTSGRAYGVVGDVTAVDTSNAGLLIGMEGSVRPYLFENYLANPVNSTTAHYSFWASCHTSETHAWAGGTAPSVQPCTAAIALGEDDSSYRYGLYLRHVGMGVDGNAFIVLDSPDLPLAYDAYSLWAVGQVVSYGGHYWKRKVDTVAGRTPTAGTYWDDMGTSNPYPPAGIDFRSTTNGTNWGTAIILPPNGIIAGRDSAGNEKAILTTGVSSDNVVRIGYQSAPASNGHLLLFANGAEKARIDPAGGMTLGAAVDATQGYVQVAGTIHSGTAFDTAIAQGTALDGNGDPAMYSRWGYNAAAARHRILYATTNISAYSTGTPEVAIHDVSSYGAWMEQTYADAASTSFIRWRYSPESATTFTDVFKIDAYGSITAPGTITFSNLAGVTGTVCATSAGVLFASATSCPGTTSITGTGVFEVGPTSDSTGAYLDLHGSATYTDYALRLDRLPGTNANSEIRHKGTGGLVLLSEEAGYVDIYTTNTFRFRVAADGKVQIPDLAGTGDRHVCADSSGWLKICP